MGLNASKINMLLEAKQDGVNFFHTLTLGKQIINLTKSEYKSVCRRYNFKCNKDSIDEFIAQEYADQFICNILNIDKLSIMDISDYEGAQIIHDLNFDIPVQLEKKYDVVIDGGTLEHIFNFPVAISNCMKMVKEGGSIFIFSMSNNHCGHGFYQFSPELFFRLFQPEYGFDIKSVVLMKHPFPGAELSKKQECYRVEDPAILGRRSTLVTKSPLGIMVHAKKIEHKNFVESFPIQSDYAKIFNTAIDTVKDKDKSKNKEINFNLKLLLRDIILKLPPSIKNFFIGYHQLWKFSLKRDKEMYTRY